MSAISTILTRLRAAIWAIDVRDDIANAIEQCYSDVSNPTLKTEALEAALQNKIDEGEMAALTIGDHTITAAKLAQGVIDNTLATSGAAADAKKTGDEIAAVKADLGALGAQTGIISKTPGYYINLTTDPVDLANLTPSNWYSYSIIECTEGDKFIINAVGSTNARTWGFLDSSNHVLSMADENAAVADLELTAPTNAVKLIINDKSGGFWYKVGNNLATKAGNGLSDDVKEALLDCFRYVAWIDDSGKLYFNALAQAMDLDDFYNTQEWDKSNGLKVGLGNLIGEYKNSIVSGPATSRAIAWCERGRAEIYSYNNDNPISFNPKKYPIPIPAEATGVTIEYTGPYALNAYIYVYDPNTKTYTQDISQMTYTVRENGRAVVEFNRQGQNQFLVPLFLVGSAAAPTNVTITFK